MHMTKTNSAQIHRVYDSFTTESGQVEYRWMWVLLGAGERRFFLTVDSARAALLDGAK